MKPSSAVQKEGPYKISRVEMKLQGISLAKLADYLYQVETSPNMVTIRRASFIKQTKGGGGIDTVLQVETMSL